MAVKCFINAVRYCDARANNFSPCTYIRIVPCVYSKSLAFVCLLMNLCASEKELCVVCSRTRRQQVNLNVRSTWLVCSCHTGHTRGGNYSVSLN